MDVSIIILTNNAGEKFTSLLRCIFSQKFEGTYEVLIIDSGSIDNTLKVAQDFPTRITRIKPEEFHHGNTRNLGAELATGKILVYITQDALPLNDNLLKRLTEDFQNPDVGMVVGRQIPWQTIKPPEKFFYYYYFPNFHIVIDNNISSYYRDNVFISNVNSAIRKNVWQQFKFSEKIIMTEDKEFAGRILANDLKIVYQPDAAVYHAHDFGIRTIFWRSVDYGISLRQGANNLSRSHRLSISKLLKYYALEIKYLIQSRCIQWVPYCIIYECSRNLGTILGMNRLAKHH